MSSLAASKKMEAPSADRNKDVLWDVLNSKIVPHLLSSADDEIRVLELAAGTGIHTHHFASLLVPLCPGQLRWYATDPSEECRESIAAYTEELRANVPMPMKLTLDENGILEEEPQKVLADLSMMLCVNMIHISPWQATIGLMKAAAQKLRPGGFLVLYGPYKVNGTAVKSNM